ncbi:MAG: 30S ribosomal protein S20 [Micavibrio sp.]|jgi:small subunit ribosomal protein S20|nr:MAG: 30S ribosomal protein S20 [Micavibrio sp.]
MANHKSAKKRIRRNERRRVINKSRISRIRTFVRKVEEAIEAGDKKAADAAFVKAQPEIHRGVSKGILHKKSASRRLSRLSRRIKVLASK